MLAPCSPTFRYYHLREICNELCGNLGLLVSGDTALSLGSFRPGGATWLYRATDSSEVVRVRGRWASARMLEVYIQEVRGISSSLPRPAGNIRCLIMCSGRRRNRPW